MTLTKVLAREVQAGYPAHTQWNFSSVVGYLVMAVKRKSFAGAMIWESRTCKQVTEVSTSPKC